MKRTMPRSQLLQIRAEGKDTAVKNNHIWQGNEGRGRIKAEETCRQHSTPAESEGGAGEKQIWEVKGGEDSEELGGGSAGNLLVSLVFTQIFNALFPAVMRSHK